MASSSTDRPWRRARYDAVVIGTGPNGLAAAALLARAGIETLAVEARPTPGGGTRTAQLTVPGFHHDVCSSVHPLGVASPCFRELELERHGVAWVHPAAPLAHVLGGGRTAILERSLDDTARGLGRDGRPYRELLAPYVERFQELTPMILAPLRWPKAPILMARFGLIALRSMTGLAASRFDEDEAPALLAGIAAHAMLRLDARATASFALVLASAAHAVGWPIAAGGSQAIADALVKVLNDAGGELVVGHRVASIDELPPAKAYLFDVTPQQLLAIAGSRLSASYRRQLERFRYGPGVFKIDWALRGPVPWRDPRCARAATVHLAGTIAEVTRSEATVHDGSLAQRPFILFVQPSLFDPLRAPAGMHTGWAYCHVPHGSTVDATAAIEAQIEEAAPGFRDLVLERTTMNAREVETYNANYVGGDINGGVADLRQLFFRPVARFDPYSTPSPDIFLCSSSTPPGGGVHGMCGYWAARSVLDRVFGKREKSA
jgi:phytoene dehydrogenase-like protein